MIVAPTVLLCNLPPRDHTPAFTTGQQFQKAQRSSDNFPLTARSICAPHEVIARDIVRHHQFSLFSGDCLVRTRRKVFLRPGSQAAGIDGGGRAIEKARLIAYLTPLSLKSREDCVELDCALRDAVQLEWFCMALH